MFYDAAYQSTCNVIGCLCKISIAAFMVFSTRPAPHLTRPSYTNCAMMNYLLFHSIFVMVDMSISRKGAKNAVHVFMLLQNYLGKGHIVYMDRYYSRQLCLTRSSCKSFRKTMKWTKKLDEFRQQTGTQIPKMPGSHILHERRHLLTAQSARRNPDCLQLDDSKSITLRLTTRLEFGLFFYCP